MKELPLSLRFRPLRELYKTGSARIRRPADGMYKGLKPGDRLWLREAYHLEKQFNPFSPSAAAVRGAVPHFASDLSAQPEELGLGGSRAAYTLLREWSRSHLIVEAVEQQPLLDIKESEARADGFSGRNTWLDEWDDLIGAVTGRNQNRKAAANPTVLVIDAQLVDQPLDARPKELA